MLNDAERLDLTAKLASGAPTETKFSAHILRPIKMMTPKPKKGIVSRGGWAVAKKLLKAIPIIGPVFTVGFAGHEIKKKGLVPGAVHVGLDVTPLVGTAKNLLEIFTGDWIPDKPPKTPQPEQGIQPALQPTSGGRPPS